VTTHWPARIEPKELDDPKLWDHIRTARAALLTALDLAELI
jgi:succinylarginine dihydrolase